MRLLRGGIALTIVALLVPAARADDAVPADLRQAREAVWRAWFANRRADLIALVPADVIAIGPGDGPWQARDEVLADAAAFAARGEKLVRLRFPRTRAQVLGDVAILYSTFEWVTSAGGKETPFSGRATEVFQRRDGRWINIGWHLDSGR